MLLLIPLPTGLTEVDRLQDKVKDWSLSEGQVGGLHRFLFKTVLFYMLPRFRITPVYGFALDRILDYLHLFDWRYLRWNPHCRKTTLFPRLFPWHFSSGW